MTDVPEPPLGSTDSAAQMAWYNEQEQSSDDLRVLAHNAADYGAVGDDSTDNTTALQNWLNAGGVSFLPPGIYRTGTLQPPNGAVIRGVNAGHELGQSGPTAQAIPSAQRSCLKAKAGLNNSHLFQAGAGVYGVEVYDIEFDGNSAGQTGGSTGRLVQIDDRVSGIDSFWIFDRCYLHDGINDGAYVGTNVQGVTFRNCTVWRCGNNGLVLKGSDGMLHRCIIGLHTAQAVFVGAWVTHIEGCDIFSSLCGIRVASGTSQVAIIGNGLDRHNQQAIYLEATTDGVNIVGNMFHSNGQQTTNTYADILNNSQSGGINIVGNAFGPLDSGITNQTSYAVEQAAGSAITLSGNNLSPGHAARGLSNEGIRNQGPDVGRTFQVSADPGGTTATTYGLAAPSLSATVTNADDTDGALLNHATGAVSGNSSGVISSAFTLLRRDWQPQMDCVIKTPATITNLRMLVGFFSANPDAAPTNIHSIFFRYDTGADGTAFWRICTAGGVAPTATATTVAVAAGTRYQMSIVCTSSAALFYINQLLVGVSTSNLPTSSQLMGYGVRVTTLSAAVANIKWSRISMSTV